MNTRFAATVIAAAASFLASASHAQTSTGGPYYATPSWDQTLPAATRFLLLANFNNDAVLDRETGLVWHRSVSPVRKCDDALASCLNSRVGNRYGWRVPNNAELKTLFDPTVTTPPFLPVGHPFLAFRTTDRAELWSQTVYRTFGHLTVEWEPSSVPGAPVEFSTGIEDDSVSVTFLCVRGSGVVENAGG